MMRIAFTGHRPQAFGGYDETSLVIVGAQRALQALVTMCADRYPDGVTFLSGMALGVDTWAAEAVLAVRNAGHRVRLIAVVPFAGQESRWPTSSQVRYREILARADEVMTLVRPTHPPTTEQVRTWLLARNCWMVDHATLVVGIWDGASGGTGHCIGYARSRGVRTVTVTPHGCALMDEGAWEVLLARSLTDDVGAGPHRNG